MPGLVGDAVEPGANVGKAGEVEVARVRQMRIGVERDVGDGVAVGREVAMRILRARLYEREVKKREEEAAKLKGEFVQADFGTQIRTVTVHPYNIVKDHRTNYETSDTEEYLNGNVDPFIYAYLQAKAGGVALGV